MRILGIGTYVFLIGEVIRVGALMMELICIYKQKYRELILSLCHVRTQQESSWVNS